MNRINPLYIGGLLLFLIFFVMFKLSSAKEQLSQAQQSYKQTQTLANDIASLKKVYAQKEKVKGSILRVLSQGSLKSADISKDMGVNGIKISSNAIDLKTLNALMGKVFNGTYNIKYFNVKKLSDDKVSLSLEIAW